ncbi:rRNA maturation RNase YbeY [Shouchella sp. JSM 1781072]|uniref:rRNA maturation RNase YbeY n=1 Tax=Shouchella sp. JSM 1781072 TaxID=3344581 RepID=UPI0035C158DE
MMIEIDIVDETETLTEEQTKLVHEILLAAGDTEHVQADSELSVTFVTEAAIHELNLEHRGIDRSTDVLSFALNDGEQEYEQMEGMPNLLGDIIVSISHIQRQAEEYNHSFERELAFLVVHGFLHLLGYDHQSSDEEREMFTKQEEILESYGIGRSKP